MKVDDRSSISCEEQEILKDLSFSSGLRSGVLQSNLPERQVYSHIASPDHTVIHPDSFGVHGITIPIVISILFVGISLILFLFSQINTKRCLQLLILIINYIIAYSHKMRIII